MTNIIKLGYDNYLSLSVYFSYDYCCYCLFPGPVFGLLGVDELAVVSKERGPLGLLRLLLAGPGPGVYCASVVLVEGGQVPGAAQSPWWPLTTRRLL